MRGGVEEEERGGKRRLYLRKVEEGADRVRKKKRYYRMFFQLKANMCTARDALIYLATSKTKGYFQPLATFPPPRHSWL